ncbi:hypothetical protein ACIRD3_25925 [Kitasatospora sp. NPDC093550]|uniref:hypothetical protein n=1 Tax=Kitasatospora sp. NPDC093550 TaxID=3364089 RepID=UPI0038265DE0
MKIDHVILAEGAAADLRGALTLVGVNQRVVNAPSLPFSFKQSLAITFTSGPASTANEAAQNGQLSVAVTGPGGDTTFAVSTAIPIAPSARKDAPSIGHILLELPISGTSHGTYRVSVTWEAPEDDRDTRNIDLYVVAPEQA